MKGSLLLLSFILLMGASSSQNICDIKDSYAEFLRIKISTNKDKKYLIKSTVAPAGDKCYGKIFENISYTNYLITHFSSDASNELLLQISDSTMLQEEYIRTVRNDSSFNAVITNLYAKTTEKRLAKDSVSMDRLLDVAVKYFSIIKINDEGKYLVKICTGVNDIKSTIKDRQPHIEAFCFASISKNLQDKEFKIYEEFTKSVKSLYKLNLGLDNNERLLRAQGAIFVMMRNNEILNSMLKSEYNNQMDVLPFILTGN